MTGVSTPEYQAIAASVTVFGADGSFDGAGQRKHFRRMVDARVGVLVGSSGAGEGYTLSIPERHELFGIASEELRGNVRFDVMGMEARSATQMVELYELAKPYGFDVFHVYGLELGHGKSPTNQELERFFRDILERVDAPCYLCNQPQMIGYPVPVDLVVNLANEYPQIVGVQDTSGDPRYLPAILRQLPERGLELITTLGHVMSTLAGGGHGFASMEANVVPHLCWMLVDSFREKRFEEAFSYYRQILSLHDVVSSGLPFTATLLPHTTKAVLDYFGLPGGHVRVPRIGLSTGDRDRLGEQVRRLTLPELQDLR